MNGIELEVSGLSDSAARRVADGFLCRGFVECGIYSFRCRHLSARLYVDDIELQRIGDTFTWKPGFYAGQVKAELVAENGRRLGCWRLDVGPTPEKLGDELFQSMVSDLLNYKPELLLGATAQQDVFSETESSAPPEVQYVRLMSRARTCCAALQRVCDQPIVRLTRDRQRVALHRVRRVDHQSVLGLVRTHTVPALQGVAPVEGMVGQVDVPIIRNTHDNAANRTMAWMLRRLAHRVAFLMDWLCGAAARDEHLGPKCARRLQMLGMLRRELQRVLCQSPFSEVARAAVSSAGLTAVSAHPVYARSFRLMWQALLAGVGSNEGSDALAVGPTWQVYERWCYLCVVDVVRAMFPGANWREQSQGSNIDQFRTRAMWDGCEFSVCMQRRFAAWDLSEGRSCRSLSRERIPDIIITATGPHGATFMVLDAKYRVNRGNVLEAMQSAHIYRDSLLYHGQRPWRSLLLVPDAVATSWLADPEFQGRFEVGTIALRERSQAGALRKTLEDFFTQACGV